MFVKPIDPKVGRRYRSLFCPISTLSVRNPAVWSNKLSVYACAQSEALNRAPQSCMQPVIWCIIVLKILCNVQWKRFLRYSQETALLAKFSSSVYTCTSPYIPPHARCVTFAPNFSANVHDGAVSTHLRPTYTLLRQRARQKNVGLYVYVHRTRNERQRGIIAPRREVIEMIARTRILLRSFCTASRQYDLVVVLLSAACIMHAYLVLLV